MISFVVPAYNEERLLGATLACLHDAAVAVAEPYEILVVDDASTDRTAAIAAEGGARVVPVRRRQIAAARNAGAREARGDRLVFVDADTRVSAELLREAIAALRAGAVGGGAPIQFEGRLPSYYTRGLEPFLLWLQRAGCLAGGCFLFCTRAAFEAVGGFDERMFGAEEIAMSRALKRHGRFVVLRESVWTSGRKLRAYSGRELLGTLASLLLRGPRVVERRDRLDLWYGPRRADPDDERVEKAAS